mgnify:CR=1 FL=1|tara:strand:- start:12068 stop:12646 length:579 start_codon:yes stop_codon:yes gene_type:complete
MKNLKGIFFDLDGTLVDSKLNFTLIKEEIGINQDQAILEYIDTLEDQDQIKSALDIVAFHEEQGALNSVIIPGVSEFLEILTMKGIPTAIITRNSKSVALKTVEMHALPFEHIITREDFPPKPDPSSLNHLLELYKLQPNECCYIGDYIFDLQAAKNAKVKAGLFLNEKNAQFKKDSDFSFTCFFELQKLLF